MLSSVVPAFSGAADPLQVDPGDAFYLDMDSCSSTYYGLMEQLPDQDGMLLPFMTTNEREDWSSVGPSDDVQLWMNHGMLLEQVETLEAPPSPLKSSMVACGPPVASPPPVLQLPSSSRAEPLFAGLTEQLLMASPFPGQSPSSSSSSAAAAVTCASLSSPEPSVEDQLRASAARCHMGPEPESGAKRGRQRTRRRRPSHEAAPKEQEEQNVKVAAEAQEVAASVASSSVVVPVVGAAKKKARAKQKRRSSTVRRRQRSTSTPRKHAVKPSAAKKQRTSAVTKDVHDEDDVIVIVDDDHEALNVTPGVFVLTLPATPKSDRLPVKSINKRSTSRRHTMLTDDVASPPTTPVTSHTQQRRNRRRNRPVSTPTAKSRRQQRTTKAQKQQASHKQQQQQPSPQPPSQRRSRLKLTLSADATSPSPVPLVSRRAASDMSTLRSLTPQQSKRIQSVFLGESVCVIQSDRNVQDEDEDEMIDIEF